MTFDKPLLSVKNIKHKPVPLHLNVTENTNYLQGLHRLEKGKGIETLRILFRQKKGKQF